MYDDLELGELRDQLERAIEKKKAAAAIEKQIKDEIIFRYKDALENKFGTIKKDGIKFVVPKNVSWDQDILAKLYQEIGETAPEYIKVAYDVSENKYKSWPSVITEQFEPARTVAAGSISIEFLDNK